MEYSSSLVPLVLIPEQGNPIGPANFLKLGSISRTLLASPAKSGPCPPPPIQEAEAGGVGRQDLLSAAGVAGGRGCFQKVVWQGRQPQTCLIQKALEGSFPFLHRRYEWHVVAAERREWLVLLWEKAQLAGSEGVGMASGRGNGLEKAQDIKYRRVVNGSAFGVVSRMRVSIGRFWALSYGTGEISRVICALERSPWRPVLRTSRKEAESEAR